MTAEIGGSEPGLQIFSPGWFEPDVGVVLRDPAEILAALRLEEVAEVFERAAELAASGRLVAGMVAFEAGPAFDLALKTHTPITPLLWFGVYESAARSTPKLSHTRYALRSAQFSLSKEAYVDAFSRIKDAIHEGDVYQINFTAPLTFEFEGNSVGLWSALMHRQPVPFGAYLDTGEMQILSCSPELFFRRERDHVLTRPMKGTVRRGSSPKEDDALESWLANDPKSQAENVMIVDLLRNDLSRCCLPGSVRVPELFTTERYSTVIQMTSEIEGRLRQDASTADVFASLFPCGSVTGAPKIEAVRLIRDLEAQPRGVYCGAVGIMQGDRAVFNVAIRTATIQGGRGVLGIGSGVVWDSDPDTEYEECLLKARFLTDLVGRVANARSMRSGDAEPPLLIETMRAEDGRIPLLELHADRLQASAAALGYSFDENEWRRRVREAISIERRPLGDSSSSQKVRSLLRSDGMIDVRTEVLSPGHREWRAVISDYRIDANDPYRRHKTTRRERYEEEWRHAVASGADEVIFLNRQDEIAEGSRTNIIVRHGDELITPPVESGALPGVYRRHLIETRGLHARTLRMKDFESADEVYLCNAVRGFVRAQIVLAPEKIREDVT